MDRSSKKSFWLSFFPSVWVISVKSSNVPAAANRLIYDLYTCFACTSADNLWAC